jgi:hypothetical protein
MLRALRRKARTAAIVVALSMVLVTGPFVLIKLFSPWPVVATLKHVITYPNCDAARFVGLAPARKGTPGYWPQHDADRDGVACEPLPSSWWIR